MEIVNKQKLNVLIAISSVLPFAFFLFIIIKYYNDIICSDEFIFMIPRVQNLFEGNFSFCNDIWAHLNEHRTVFPIILVLIIARFFDWNLSYELAIGIFFYSILFVLIIHQVKKTRKALGIDAVNWITPIISLLIFSIIHWKTFAMGLLTIVNSLLVLSASAGIIIIAKNVFSYQRLSAAFLLGIISTFSFGAGIVYWPVGFFSLLFSSHDNFHIKRLSMGLWIGVSFAVMMLYSFGFRRNINIVGIFHHPLEYLKFVLGYIGAPLCNFNLMGAIICGAVGILGSFCFAGILIRHKYIKVTEILPYLCLSLFSVLNACLTGIGRLFIFPTEGFLVRGWKIIATPFWISFFVFLYFFVYFSLHENSIRFKRVKTFKTKKFVLIFPAVVLISATLVTYSISCSNSLNQLREFYNMNLSARAELLLFTDNRPIDAYFLKPMIIHTTLENIQKGISFLKKHKLSFFREGGPYYFKREKEIQDTITKILKAQDAGAVRSMLYFQLGRLYERRGETEKAIAQYQKTLSISPDSTRALTRLAEIYAAAKRYNTSISFYKKILTIEPNWKICHNIAWLYSKQNKIGQAIEWLNAAINAQNAGEERPMLYFHLGRLYEQTGETDKAIMQYQKILSANPNDIHAKKRLSEIYAGSEK